jgi:hypothetical protein
MPIYWAAGLTLKGNGHMNVCESKDQRRSATAGFGGSSEFVGAPGDIWSLRLYVAGQSANSVRACADVMTLSDQHLAEQCEIEIIDLIQHPSLARRDDIVAVPTLVVDVHAHYTVHPGGSVLKRRRMATRKLVGSRIYDALAALVLQGAHQCNGTARLGALNIDSGG